MQIQCNTDTYSQTFFLSAIRLWNTLPVDICQLSPDSLKTISAVSISSEHRTTSCFYRLHCTVFIRSYCSLFAARLSRYTSAYSLIVQYCSELSQHRYGKEVGRKREEKEGGKKRTGGEKRQERSAERGRGKEGMSDSRCVLL